METAMEPHFAKLNKPQKEIINSILTEAFSDDPVFSKIFSNNMEIRTFFNLAIEYVNTFGEIHIMDDNSGVALWMPPGIRFLYIGNSFKTFPLIWKSIVFIITVRLSSIRKLLSISRFSSENHPKESHYYLFAIGVANKSKGMGIGKKLVHYAFSRFGNNKPYYLENSNIVNLGFYNSLGFSLFNTSSFKWYTIFQMGKNLVFSEKA